ncbi:hypothetical protein Tco_0576179 [Tanacetum coccineum]
MLAIPHLWRVVLLLHGFQCKFPILSVFVCPRGIPLSELGQSKAFGDVILASLELGTKYLEPRQLSEGKWDFTLMILMQGKLGTMVKQ